MPLEPPVTSTVLPVIEPVTLSAMADSSVRCRPAWDGRYQTGLSTAITWWKKKSETS